MMKNSSVTFQTSDSLVQKLFDTAEQRCLGNIADFCGNQVLIEGAGYEKIWLETQPMGGEMYAKRNMEVALNNQLMFMEHIREDGRLPGSIALIDGKVIPQYNKIQGFCFPASALNMYYLADLGQDYLEYLYSTLVRFDTYLWMHRDTDGDGCLESFCKYDTGEDHSTRYFDAPNDWTEEKPPVGYRVVPMASLDFMSFSYACRETLSEISCILGKEDLAKGWKKNAEKVQNKISSYLWCEEDATFYDRANNGEVQKVLYHNPLRAMYFHSITNAQAREFVSRHLLNEKEFFTRMPLPSIAVCDPLFRNIPTNDWSGQVEALTYQRAIRALENYGYDALIPVLGRKLFEAVGESCAFVQQFDPFTGKPSITKDNGGNATYGPALLATLEYISRMYGVHREKNTLYWGCIAGAESDYTQILGERSYRLVTEGNLATGYVDGKKIFETNANKKLITDLNGVVKKVIDYSRDMK